MLRIAGYCKAMAERLGARVSGVRFFQFGVPIYYSSVSSSAKGIVSLSFGNARLRLRLNESQLDAARINASTAHKCCCNFG